ncbi:uncharacterized protein LOC123559132 isoform X1 [Mercenaria mercenaria]|uniref:uncharacterized protein LOC123559132 isoform X1 n=1 Tax=Mercenaria mercenaria TaxID=6596 RepID=UPI00234E8EDC|nr:uncharacterized protein LOC123559132 isoform X1 [Mercenaria mercenaria]
MAKRNDEPSKPSGSCLKIDKLCTPCNDKRVPADRFCIECGAFLCMHCSQNFHAAIPALAKHVILKDDEIDVWGQLQYKCETHDQMFTFFCKGHDVLCCAVCIQLKHSLCRQKEYIQTAAEGICNAQGLAQLQAETKGILDKISECTKKFQLKSKANLESKNKVMESIRQNRQKINALFDVLDQNALKQMEAKFDSNKAYINESLDKLNSYSNKSKLLNQQVNSACEDKNCLVYICLNEGNKLVKNIKQNISGMDSTTAKDNFMFAVDEKIEYFVKTRKETGHVEDDHSRSSDKCGAKRQVIPQDKGDLICHLEENKKLLEKYVAEMKNNIKEKDRNISALEDKVRDISRQNDDLKKARDDLETRVQDLETKIKTQQEHILKTEETCKTLAHGKDLEVALPTLCKELSVLEGSKLRDLYNSIKEDVARLTIRNPTVQVYGIGDIKDEVQMTMSLLVSHFSYFGMVLQTKEITDPQCILPNVPLLVIGWDEANPRAALGRLSFAQAIAIIVLSKPPKPFNVCSLRTEHLGPKNVLKYLKDVYQCEMVCAVSVKGSILANDVEAVHKIIRFIRTALRAQ